LDYGVVRARVVKTPDTGAHAYQSQQDRIKDTHLFFQRLQNYSQYDWLSGSYPFVRYLHHSQGR
jgi:hypothetical protein